MTHVLVDTSVLIRWFHADGESELAPARALREAHVTGEVEAHILDLALYEIAECTGTLAALGRHRHRRAIGRFAWVVGPPMAMPPAWLRDAAMIAKTVMLSFDDASWAATAAGLSIPLISADRRLIKAGLAESVTDATARLRLAP